jgi:hypothetical protein
LRLSEELGRKSDWAVFKNDLFHRQARLQRKISPPRRVNPDSSHSDQAVSDPSHRY